MNCSTPCLPVQSTLHIRWPKDWSFSFSISPSNEHPGLISFRMDWFSLQSKGLSRVFSNTTVQKHQFFQWISSVQSLSHVQLFATPWSAARQASLSITNSRSLLKLMSIKSVMPSNHPILCHPLLLLPSVFPSIKVFSNELALCIRWPKYWSFSFNISPSNEYSGFIFFRIAWFDLRRINSKSLSLLYGPTLTSIHDYWKKHSFD